MLSSVTIYAISENYLTAKEFDILALLITHPQRVFTYELIMELVWNEDVNLLLTQSGKQSYEQSAEEIEDNTGWPGIYQKYCRCRL